MKRKSKILRNENYRCLGDSFVDVWVFSILFFVAAVLVYFSLVAFNPQVAVSMKIV